MPDVVVVAAEELVAAFSRQRNLDVLAGELETDTSGSQTHRRTARRRPRPCAGRSVGRVGPQDDLVVIGRVAIGDEASGSALVEGAFLEADGERLHRPGALLRRERDDQRRIDARPRGGHRQERRRSDGRGRSRGGALAAPRRASSSSSCADCRLAADSGRRDSARCAASGSCRPRPDEHAAGRRACALSRKIVSGAGTKLKARYASSASRSISREKPGHAKQRLQLGCERERSRCVEPVVQRLDPEAIAGEHEPALARVPERDREHPPEPLDEIRGRAPRRGGRAPRCRSCVAEAVAAARSSSARSSR